MADDIGRPPLSPFWWEGKSDTPGNDPPLLSPLWWNEHTRGNGGDLPLLHPLGLNEKEVARPAEEPPEEDSSASVDEEFQERVNKAYETLPSTIRELPDFPPIEILEEPLYPTPGRETLGRFFGIPRSKKVIWLNPVTPTVIHVYRGPVLRYAGNQVDGVLKTVVWHEVAHWLGFQTEQEVAELGLQLGPSPNATGP
jgi:predicted Zn-dependent protease with MMP-like domain